MKRRSRSRSRTRKLKKFYRGESVILGTKTKAIVHITREGNTHVVIYYYPEGLSIQAKAKQLGIRNLNTKKRKYHFELETFTNARWHDSGRFSPTLAKPGVATKVMCKFFRLFKKGHKYYRHREKNFLVRTGFLVDYWKIHGREKFNPSKLKAFYKGRFAMDTIGNNFEGRPVSDSDALLISTPARIKRVCSRLRSKSKSRR